MSQPTHTLGAPQPAAYVFGPWITPTDRPNFAYRSAPREDDRAEVWLHVPDDGSEPYWAGCYGGSDCFNLLGPSTLDEAKRVMDQRLVLAGHLLAECVDRDRRNLDAAQRWQDVARVAREIDAQHRGAGLMADDDLVDLIERALKDFPGLVRERDRLQAVLDAEMGRKGLPGWVYDGYGQWTLSDHTADIIATAATDRRGIGWYIGDYYGESTDALDGMEKATARLRELGLIPADQSKP